MGYWNVKLAKKLQAITTFNTEKCRYRFLRMPFGLKMSQDISQRKTDQTYENSQGSVEIVDDLQVVGIASTHDLYLHEAKERTRKAGIKLNFDKCITKSKYCSSSEKYTFHHQQSRNLIHFLLLPYKPVI